MSLNSVQSFVIENCNGPTIENGLNNVCLHPLSRTFTFISQSMSVYAVKNHISNKNVEKGLKFQVILRSAVHVKN